MLPEVGPAGRAGAGAGNSGVPVKPAADRGEPHLISDASWGWAQFTDFHMVTSIGAWLFGLTQVYWLLFIVIPNIRGGEPAPPKPSEGAEGLEWRVPGPAPFHTFDTPPLVK